jgi:hypothetical protein
MLQLDAAVTTEGFDHFGKGTIGVLPHCAVFRVPREINCGNGDAKSILLSWI